MKERRWWLAAAMCIVNALVSLSFSLADLMSGSVYARYCVARSVPLAIVTLIFVARRASRELATVALILGLVQASDAVVGLLARDVGKTVGPLIFALLTLASIRWLQASSLHTS
jgi:hypothetical protein